MEIAASCHIRISDPAAVEAVARAILRSPAWLSDAKGGWVSFYDGWPDRFNLDEAHRLAQHLSGCLTAPAVAFISREPADMAYTLFDKGALQDEFAVPVSWFAPQAPADQFAGKPDVLLLYSRDGASFSAILQVLAQPEPGRDSSATPQFLNMLRDQLRDRLPPGSLSPDLLQKMLLTAADQMRYMPPAMLDAMFSSMGLPAHHPALAALKADPAGFISQMASNPQIVSEFTQQISSHAGSEPPALSAAARRAGLADLLGIDETRIALDFAALEASPQAGFTRLSS